MGKVSKKGKGEGERERKGKMGGKKMGKIRKKYRRGSVKKEMDLLKNNQLFNPKSNRKM